MQKSRYLKLMKLNKIYFLLFILIGNTAYSQANQIDEPIKNFEALWSEFNLRYANFELKRVDWDKVYSEYRPQINAQTTNQALFEISCAMLQELNDGHVTMDPNFEEEYINCGPPYNFLIQRSIFPTSIAFQQFESVIDATFLSNGFSQAQHLKVTEATNYQYRTATDLGYLRFDEMTEVLTFGRLKKALNKTLAAFQGKKGVIIDLRFNGGGWDKMAYKVAGRFVAKKQVGHLKKQRKKGTTKFGKLKSFSVKPKGKYQFTKPIIILTSDFTASAAEVFLLAMKDLPYVTIIGDTTEGIFSDMHEFKLPNKWEVSLSHQQFFSREMINYEGIGIEPDVKVLNSRKDLATNIDPVIAKAISFLKK